MRFLDNPTEHVAHFLRPCCSDHRYQIEGFFAFLNSPSLVVRLGMTSGEIFLLFLEPINPDHLPNSTIKVWTYSDWVICVLICKKSITRFMCRPEEL